MELTYENIQAFVKEYFNTYSTVGQFPETAIRFWPKPYEHWKDVKRCCAPRSVMSPGACWKTPVLCPTVNTPWNP